MTTQTHTDSSTPHDRLVDLPDPDLLSDGGRGAEAIFQHLEAPFRVRRVRQRFDFVMARLTRRQHELFALIVGGRTREEICREFHITASTLSERLSRLAKKVEKILAEMPN